MKRIYKSQRKFHWSNGGEAITNFDISEAPLYMEAIRLNNDDKYYIAEEIPCGPDAEPCLALRRGYYDTKDTSRFWRIFDSIKQNF